MKRSNEESKPLDLEQSLSTTKADVAALKAAKRDSELDSREYLDFLSSLPASPQPLRFRKGPTGVLPFTL